VGEGGRGVQKGSPVSAYVFIRNMSAATNQKLQDVGDLSCDAKEATRIAKELLLLWLW